MKRNLYQELVHIAYAVYYHSPHCPNCLGHNIRRSNRIIRVAKLREYYK